MVAALGEPALAEGGDMCWLDASTLLVGLGYRTTTAGLDALRDRLPDVNVVSFDLPYLAGPAACTHLLSFVSISTSTSRWPRCRTCPFVSWSSSAAVASRSWRCPRQSSTRWARTCWPSDRASRWRSRATRRRAGGWRPPGSRFAPMKGSEISRKGDGGPTCLTKPLERG